MKILGKHSNIKATKTLKTLTTTKRPKPIKIQKPTKRQKPIKIPKPTLKPNVFSFHINQKPTRVKQCRKRNKNKVTFTLS
jgi:hypothetical protein